jgi:hypothetical protein
VDSGSHVVNNVLPEAFGPRGVSGDAVKIVYVARRLGGVYEKSIEWTHDARQTSGPEEYQELIRIAGTFLNDNIRNTEKFAEELLSKTEGAIEKGTAEGGSHVVEATLTFVLSNLEEFHGELDRLRREGLY